LTVGRRASIATLPRDLDIEERGVVFGAEFQLKVEEDEEEGEGRRVWM
jgi:hypothetical protein